MTDTATFRVWRSEGTGGKLVDYTTRVSPGMVVLDAIHQIQAEQEPHLPALQFHRTARSLACSAWI